jgi:hypothetical protein
LSGIGTAASCRELCPYAGVHSDSRRGSPMATVVVLGNVR